MGEVWMPGTFTDLTKPWELYALNQLLGDITRELNAADVVISGTVSDNAITNAKLANTAQSTVKGRQAGAGTGDPDDLTVAEVLTIIEGTIDHGSIAGLTGDDHTQYTLHSLADAANDFLVASGANTFVKKTLAETGAILEADLDHGNIQGLGDDDHTQYFLKANSMCSLDAGADTTCSTETNTPVLFSAELFDTDTLHDVSSNTSRITVARTGKYLFTAAIYMDGNTTGERWLGFRVGGSTLYWVDVQDASAATGMMVNGSITLSLSTTNYVEVVIWQNSGGNLNTNHSYSWFTCTYIGA